MNDLVLLDHGSEFCVTSRNIADFYGKEHKHVLRDIRNLEGIWIKSHGPNLDCQIYGFRKQKYKCRGKEYDEYVLTKTETLFIVSGYDASIRAKLVIRWEYLELKARERQQSRLEAPEMTLALKEYREGEGRETRHYHYSNEMNLVNKVVLGATAKKWREVNDLDDKTPIRDTLTPNVIAAIRDIQKKNTSLIELGMPYDERKNRLNSYFNKKWDKKITDEFLSLNA